MKLFIDCEYNGFKGDLISMGIIDENDNEFYEVLGCEKPSSWVDINVIPILNKNSITLKEFQSNLQDYLNTYESVELIADWPEDAQWFCWALVNGLGHRIKTPMPISILIDNELSSEKALLRHNALSDARAIKDSYYAKKKEPRVL